MATFTIESYGLQSDLSFFCQGVNSQKCFLQGRGTVCFKIIQKLGNNYFLKMDWEEKQEAVECAFSLRDVLSVSVYALSFSNNKSG